MEGTIADELYFEALRLSKTELDPASTANCKQDVTCDCDAHDLWDGDDSMWDGSSEELIKPCDLDREWKNRRNQFHNVGYRDGLTAGKEASAQEGFNLGFEQSVLVGYNWGLVRGVTSALAYLPDVLKEKLVEKLSNRERFHCLHRSVHTLSTTDALRLFHDDILTHKSENETQYSEATTSSVPDLRDRNSDCNHLGTYFGELQSLLSESPAIEVNLSINQ